VKELHTALIHVPANLYYYIQLYYFEWSEREQVPTRARIIIIVVVVINIVSSSSKENVWEFFCGTKSTSVMKKGLLRC